MTFSPGISEASTRMICDQSKDGSYLMLRIFPCGIVLRTVAPWSIFGKEMSSIYLALPVTFSTPSMRGGELPTKPMPVTYQYFFRESRSLLISYYPFAGYHHVVDEIA